MLKVVDFLMLVVVSLTLVHVWQLGVWHSAAVSAAVQWLYVRLREGE